MKYFEISVLTANSRYLQTAALKRPILPLTNGEVHTLGYDISFLGGGGQLFKSWLAVNNEFKLTSNLVLI